jgi:hypothetical protein
VAVVPTVDATGRLRRKRSRGPIRRTPPARLSCPTLSRTTVDSGPKQHAREIDLRERPEARGGSAEGERANAALAAETRSSARAARLGLLDRRRAWSIRTSSRLLRRSFQIR